MKYLKVGQLYCFCACSKSSSADMQIRNEKGICTGMVGCSEPWMLLDKPREEDAFYTTYKIMTGNLLGWITISSKVEIVPAVK